MRSVITQYRAESAASLTLIMAGLSMIGVVYTLNAKDVRTAKAWENMLWDATACAVAGIGVAYRGNCNMETDVEMAVGEFNECPGLLKGDLGWNAETAKVCLDAGNAAYIRSRDEVRGRSLQGSVAIFNPPNWIPPDIRCQNGYLFWLNVALNITDSSGMVWLSNRCAYEFGAESPSIMGVWSGVRTMQSRFESTVGAANTVPCWRLNSDDCVVAFHNPADFTAQQATEALFSQAMAVICGTLSLLSAFSTCYFAWVDARFTAYSPLPGEDIDPIEQNVGEMLRSAAAADSMANPSEIGFRRAQTMVSQLASLDVTPEINATPEEVVVPATKRDIHGLDPSANIAMMLMYETNVAGDDNPS